MPDSRQTAALAACDDALKTSVGNISSVLFSALTSAKTTKQRQSVIDAARKSMEVTKETDTTMRGIVESVFA
jgi:outer membrane protein TolC